MKYAFNTWVYGSFPVWVPSYTLDETIRRLARIGYDGIEIGCAAPHAWPAHLNAARRKEIKNLLDSEGITPVSLLPAPGGGPGNNPASVLPEERRATVEHYKEVVDLAADLGAGLVLYVAGWYSFGVSQQDAWNWSRESLTAIAQYAQDKAITIAVEPTSADSNLIDTADEALALMRESGQANVGVMFDTYHALYRNEVSADYVRTMGDALVHMHASEVDRLPPGPGAVDWLGVMQALKDIKYDGYITMEIGFNSRSADADAYARRALQYLKGIEAQLKEPQLVSL